MTRYVIDVILAGAIASFAMYIFTPTSLGSILAPLLLLIGTIVVATLHRLLWYRITRGNWPSRQNFKMLEGQDRLGTFRLFFFLIFVTLIAHGFSRELSIFLWIFYSFYCIFLLPRFRQTQVYTKLVELSGYLN